MFVEVAALKILSCVRVLFDLDDITQGILHLIHL